LEKGMNATTHQEDTMHTPTIDIFVRSVYKQMYEHIHMHKMRMVWEGKWSASLFALLQSRSQGVAGKE
jgi:hypothetical protein